MAHSNAVFLVFLFVATSIISAPLIVIMRWRPLTRRGLILQGVLFTTVLYGGLAGAMLFVMRLFLR